MNRRVFTSLAIASCVAGAFLVRAHADDKDHQHKAHGDNPAFAR